MNKTKVYDLPTRLLHWLFAVLFLSAFFIANTVDDESQAFTYHMLIGLVLALVVVLRIGWGLIGSRYARFSSFHLRPSGLFRYFADFFTGKTSRTLGHNPASSWVALIMFALALGLGLTGCLMTAGGQKEAFEDLHELMANAFIGIVIVHVTGVILHSLRHKDWIALSMINGKKESIRGETGIGQSYKGTALMFLTIIAVFAFHVGKNFDAQSQSLHLFGQTLQLGESENAGESQLATNPQEHWENRAHHDRDRSDEED